MLKPHAYWKTWLQFIFPIYVWTIAGAIIAGLGRIPYLDQRFPKNIVQVLATLVLLSYSKLLRTIITALVFAKIDIYSYGIMKHKDSVWKLDSNIDYGQYPHCILFSVALLALIFLFIPYTLILPFIKYTRRWRFMQRLMPFFEAYTGQLTPNCQFWVGLLLLVRCVLLFTLVLLRPDASVLSMVVIMILIFVLLYNTGSIYNGTTDVSIYKCCHFLPKRTSTSFIFINA